jgi:poly(hydroxyalkanoate) depolymerase family esterase
MSAVTFAASPCLAAWATNVSYGGTLKMDLYTPTTVAASPGVIVAIHYCTGNAGVTHSWFQSLADKYGFYIISPDAGKQCFDSSASRDGDKAAIVKMVDYVITEKKADKARVFAAGASSGGCMTNTLLAVYPDVFAGGAAAPGFPAGGWPAGDTTCTKCSSTPPTKTAKEWGDIARNVFAYTGARPKVQEWVGANDEYNFNGWLPSVVLQFQDLLGLDNGTTATGPSNWTRKEYKDSSGKVMLQTNIGSGMKHDVTGTVPWADVVSFFGLDKSGGGTGGTGGTGGVTSTTASGGKSSSGGSGGTSSGTKVNTGGKSSTGGGSSAIPSGSTTGKGGAPSTANTGKGGNTPTSSVQGNGGAVSPISSSGAVTAPSTYPVANGGSAAVGPNVTTVVNTAPSNGGSAPMASGTSANENDDSGGCTMTSTGTQNAHGSALAAFAAILAGVAIRRRRKR